MTSCGRYIFMPAFENLSYDDVGIKAVDQYIQSYIYTHGQYQKVCDDVENIIEECGLSTDYIGFMNDNTSDENVDLFSTYASMTGLVTKYLMIIIVVMIICITSILSIVLVNLIQEENFNFGVYIMCGMKPGKLALILFLFDMSVVGISDIVTVWILLMKNTGALSILIVQAVMLAILAVSYIVCYVNLKRVDISSLFRRKRMSLIKLNNICVEYGRENKQRALNDVSMEIDDKEFVAVMGKKRLWKTTLLNVLGTLLKPQSGEYIFDGKPVLAKNSNELAEFRNENMGFVVQHFALVPDMSIYDNVALPLTYRKMSKSDVKNRVMAVLEELEIYDQKK